jgi:CheY-like chemotaxis protein
MEEVCAVERSAAVHSDSAPRRLLVVDDHDDSRILLVRLLGRSYQVNSAHSYETALAEASRTPPNAVISDIRLAGEDGIMLMKKLRDLYGVPGIAVTGDPVDVRTLREAGFVAHLMKPIHFQELLHAIDAACRTSGEPEPVASR